MSSVHAALAPRTAWRAAAWYLLATVVMTWPLATGLARDIPWDLGDSLLNCWILGWNSEHILRALHGDWDALRGFYDAMAAKNARKAFSLVTRRKSKWLPD